MNIRRAFFGVTLLAVGLASTPVFADGVSKLKAFTQSFTSFQANFKQTVYDADDQVVQASSGEAFLKKPGRFRWNYQTPYKQLLVADGKVLWVYDIDLAQVTQRQMDKALSQAPAALLGGNVDLEKQYRLKNLGERDGVSWVQVTPKREQADFQTLYIGMGKQGPKVMQMRDALGQSTEIEFSKIQHNVKMNDKLFKFTPPKGADVIKQ